MLLAIDLLLRFEIISNPKNLGETEKNGSHACSLPRGLKNSKGSLGGDEGKEMILPFEALRFHGQRDELERERGGR